MEQTTWKRSIMEKSCSVVLEFSFRLSNIGDVTLIRCRVCSQGKNAGSVFLSALRRACMQTCFSVVGHFMQ